jgi:hypothetical protein
VDLPLATTFLAPLEMLKSIQQLVVLMSYSKSNTCNFSFFHFMHVLLKEDTSMIIFLL